MQPISAAAGDGVIQRDLQVIVTEEPVEPIPGLFAPTVVTCDSVGDKTRGHRACSLNRLLIEAGSLSILMIEALRTYWYEVVVCFAMLNFRKPVKGCETGGNHAIVRTSRTNNQ